MEYLDYTASFVGILPFLHRRTWPGKSGKWCICVTCNSQSKSLWGKGAIPLHMMIL